MTPEVILHGVEIIAGLAVFVVGLMIKNAIFRMETKLTKGQYDLASDFNAKHAENKHDLDVHVAKDDGQFASFHATLGRMEKKLDELAARH